MKTGSTNTNQLLQTKTSVVPTNISFSNTATRVQIENFNATGTMDPNEKDGFKLSGTITMNDKEYTIKNGKIIKTSPLTIQSSTITLSPSVESVYEQKMATEEDTTEEDRKQLQYIFEKSFNNDVTVTVRPVTE
tara:strand:- start:91 stop:492 length:402 start_codon:yes stop_codon:yes gene_type:complete